MADRLITPSLLASESNEEPSIWSAYNWSFPSTARNSVESQSSQQLNDHFVQTLHAKADLQTLGTRA